MIFFVTTDLCLCFVWLCDTKTSSTVQINWVKLQKCYREIPKIPWTDFGKRDIFKMLVINFTLVVEINNNLKPWCPA